MQLADKYAVKYQLIQTLADGEWHSGESLGEAFGMSRAGIAKHMKGLIDWGLDIQSVKGKGYQLSKPLNLLDEDLISQALSVPFELIPVIDSTNQYLMDQISRHQAPLVQGLSCAAEYQAQGRGRRGRQWLSPFGSNIYVSMYWHLESGIAAAMGLSLAIGVAIVDALQTLGADDVKLKWPNDIYYQDKKLAGVLVELSGQTGGGAEIVIGMGLNIQMQDKDSQIDQAWVSLEQIFAEQNKTLPTRSEILSQIINAWHKCLLEYEKQGLGAFVDAFNQKDNFKDKPVKLLMGSKEVHGIARGINQQGAILLETEAGITPYVGGEISLRPA